MIVRPDDPAAADVQVLLEQHLALMRSQSAPEDVHALDVTGLQAPAVTFLSCREDGVLLGVGALSPVTQEVAEVKSMHTVAAARGRGVARRVLVELLRAASEQGFSQVSLETGSQPAFAAARALYRSAGFVECSAFGDYLPSAGSVFLTRSTPAAG